MNQHFIGYNATFCKKIYDIFVPENQVIMSFLPKISALLGGKFQIEILKIPIFVIFTSSNGEY